ncbi:MAG: hypothetical protein WDW38_006125 [Sanguina aurantia]
MHSAQAPVRQAPTRSPTQAQRQQQLSVRALVRPKPSPLRMVMMTARILRGLGSSHRGRGAGLRKCIATRASACGVEFSGTGLPGGGHRQE